MAASKFDFVRESAHSSNGVEVSKAIMYRQANGCFHLERFYMGVEQMPVYNLGEDEAVEMMQEWVDTHTV